MCKAAISFLDEVRIEHEEARCLLSELKSVPLSKTYRLLSLEEEARTIGLPWPFDDDDTGGDDPAGTLLRLSRFPSAWVPFFFALLSVDSQPAFILLGSRIDCPLIPFHTILRET